MLLTAGAPYTQGMVGGREGEGADHSPITHRPQVLALTAGSELGGGVCPHKCRPHSLPHSSIGTATPTAPPWPVCPQPLRDRTSGHTAALGAKGGGQLGAGRGRACSQPHSQRQAEVTAPRPTARTVVIRAFMSETSIMGLCRPRPLLSADGSGQCQSGSPSDTLCLSSLCAWRAHGPGPAKSPHVLGER